MIEAIYVLGIAAILVNIAALTLLVLRYISFPAIARATGIIAICLGLFSLEHFVGLGPLYPLFLPLTALSLSVDHWEETCDYYIRHFPFETYGKKWTERKGQAIHTESDFKRPLYEWGDELFANAVRM